jgi:NADPH-dependent 7-cyano-7-deazaguanine reductase QueF
MSIYILGKYIILQDFLSTDRIRDYNIMDSKKVLSENLAQEHHSSFIYIQYHSCLCHINNVPDWFSVW